MPADAPLELRAGPLCMTYEAGTLRHIRLGSRLLLTQLYAAVRDENWGTVPGRIRLLEKDIQPDQFDLRLLSAHRNGDVAFTWQGHLAGRADGTLTFSFDGVAERDFKRNRIGFCALHPASLAGEVFTATHPDGSSTTRPFPVEISPHQPAFNLSALEHAAAPNLALRLTFAGDTFEMEDQRNWTDASYKTYCTPLAAPFPVMLRAGDEVKQRLTLELFGSAPESEVSDMEPVITAGSGKAPPVPPLGLAANHLPETLDTGRLRALNLAHLRVDLALNSPYQTRLERVSALANELGARLEPALFLGDGAEAELQGLLEQLSSLKPSIARWLTLSRTQKTTPKGLLEAARQVLGKRYPDVPVIGGTDAFFAEFNREPPPAEALEGVCYSLNPQVHAFDDRSLLETLPMQGVTVDNARRLAAGKPVVLSPVTFKMRWNPNATADASLSVEAQAERRQTQLFGAAWTLGSLASLIRHGAASATYFEVSGPLGVMVDERAPEGWAQAGVYPLYHVLADVGAFAGGQVLGTASSHPDAVEALLMTHSSKTALLVANLTGAVQRVRLEGLEGVFRLRRLAEDTSDEARLEPEAFRTQSGTKVTLPGSILLPAYAYGYLERS